MQKCKQGQLSFLALVPLRRQSAEFRKDQLSLLFCLQAQVLKFKQQYLSFLTFLVTRRFFSFLASGEQIYWWLTNYTEASNFTDMSTLTGCYGFWLHRSWFTEKNIIILSLVLNEFASQSWSHFSITLRETWIVMRRHSWLQTACESFHHAAAATFIWSDDVLRAFQMAILDQFTHCSKVHVYGWKLHFSQGKEPLTSIPWCQAQEKMEVWCCFALDCITGESRFFKSFDTMRPLP